MANSSASAAGHIRPAPSGGRGPLRFAGGEAADRDATPIAGFVRCLGSGTAWLALRALIRDTPACFRSCPHHRRPATVARHDGGVASRAPLPASGPSRRTGGMLRGSFARGGAVFIEEYLQEL